MRVKYILNIKANLQYDFWIGNESFQMTPLLELFRFGRGMLPSGRLPLTQFEDVLFTPVNKASSV